MSIFTVEIDGCPTVVFDASSIEEAQGICALPEFRADLCELTTDGTPLCQDIAVLSARYATSAEVASFNYAVSHAASSDAPTMAFLVRVDGVVISIADLN